MFPPPPQQGWNLTAVPAEYISGTTIGTKNFPDLFNVALRERGEILNQYLQ